MGNFRQSDVQGLIAHETNAARLLHFWRAWRSAVGEQLPDSYAKLIELINRGMPNFTYVELDSGAIENGFTDGGAMWRSPYELSSRNQRPKMDMVTELNKLFQEILPFYQQVCPL